VAEGLSSRRRYFVLDVEPPRAYTGLYQTCSTATPITSVFCRPGRIALILQEYPVLKLQSAPPSTYMNTHIFFAKLLTLLPAPCGRSGGSRLGSMLRRPVRRDRAVLRRRSSALPRDRIWSCILVNPRRLLLGAEARPCPNRTWPRKRAPYT